MNSFLKISLAGVFLSHGFLYYVVLLLCVIEAAASCEKVWAFTWELDEFWIWNLPFAPLPLIEKESDMLPEKNSSMKLSLIEVLIKIYYLLFYYYIIYYFHLFESQKETSRKDIDWHNEVFQLLVCSLNVPNSLGHVRLRPVAGNSIWDCHRCGRCPSTCATACCFVVSAWGGSWSRSGAETKTRHSDIGNRCLSSDLTVEPNTHPVISTFWSPQLQDIVLNIRCLLSYICIKGIY